MQQYDRGYRRNALWQMSPVNTLIIVINVLVFAGLSFLGDTTDVRFSIIMVPVSGRQLLRNMSITDC